MTGGEDGIRAEVGARVASLPASALRQLKAIVSALGESCEFTISAEFGDRFAEEFCAMLKLHHATSAEPFRKDKLEFGLVAIFTTLGVEAERAATGNPGHDLTVGGVRWSVKTQADSGIKNDRIWISKFKELGKGDWSSESDLRKLRDQMLEHLGAYERIFTLRCLTPSGTPLADGVEWVYELVEIPKAVLQMASGGEFEMMTKSRQTPRPGYCRVFDDERELVFALYFDGGSERKLQVKDLDKAYCIVHGTWRFRSAA